MRQHLVSNGGFISQSLKDSLCLNEPLWPNWWWDLVRPLSGNGPHQNLDTAHVCARTKYFIQAKGIFYTGREEYFMSGSGTHTTRAYEYLKISKQSIHRIRGFKSVKDFQILMLSFLHGPNFLPRLSGQDQNGAQVK